MRRIIKPMLSAMSIYQGEKVNHPVLGSLEIVGIYEVTIGRYEAYCKLLEFNDTARMIDLKELSKIKLGKRNLRLIK